MTGDQQSALAALKAVEPIASRLDGSRQPEDRAADILELWQGTETALRALMGGSQLSGQGLIRELRQRELISLGQAYALLEFLGARDRANRTTYHATDNDMVVAREGFRQLEGTLSAAAASEAATPSIPIPPPVAAAPTAQPPASPVNAAPDYSHPTTQASRPAAPSSSPYAPPPPWSQPGAVPPVTTAPIAASSPPPVAEDPGYADRPGTRPPNLWLIVAIAVLVIAAIGGYFAFAHRGSPDKQLNDAIAAMQGGRREAARGGFEQVARENPNLATPHIFLSRMSREDGDLVNARTELETAIRLDPGNAIALREMGLILFSAGNYELSRRFFVRAINANPNDRASQGYLGCALARLNRMDEAQRFITRAGPGSWSTCLPAGPL